MRYTREDGRTAFTEEVKVKPEWEIIGAITGLFIVVSVFCASFVAMLSVVLYKAYVIMHFWKWFVTPAFNVVVPSFWVIYGLMFMFAFMTYNMQKTESPKSANPLGDLLKSIGKACVLVSVYFFFGYIIQGFV